MASKVYRYSCDCGGLAVGSDACRTLIWNCEGDGTFNLFVTDREDFKAIEDGFELAGVCQGDAVAVYDYDCDGGKPLCVLSGRFGVYRRRRSGDMAVVRWE